MARMSRESGRCGCSGLLVLIIVAVLIWIFFFHPESPYAERVVEFLNTEYGRVCRAELEGLFEKTIKIDWTSDTTRIHAYKILGEIGEIKEALFRDRVRYLQFPNDGGTYNVIDWKTGDKWSVPERAPYYFK